MTTTDQIAAEAAEQYYKFEDERGVFLGHRDELQRIITDAMEKAVNASKQVCEIYFRIAADAVGEEAVRIRRDAMIEVWEKSRAAQAGERDHLWLDGECSVCGCPDYDNEATKKCQGAGGCSTGG